MIRPILFGLMLCYMAAIVMPVLFVYGRCEAEL